MKKRVVLYVVVLSVLSLILTNFTSAYVTKPSVPSFTIKFVAYPYDVPPKYGIDQYSGKSVIIGAGYHVENKSLEVAIRNQPFSPYVTQDPDGYADWTVSLFYSVRVKGHFGEVWTELYRPFGYYTDSGYSYATYKKSVQSNSENTVLPCPADYPDGAQVDFQVEAVLGYYYTHPMWDHPLALAPVTDFVTVGTSGWSNTQTLVFHSNDTLTGPYNSPVQGPSVPSPGVTPSREPPASTPEPSPSQTAVPTPEQRTESAANEASQLLQSATILGAIAAVAVVSVGLLLYLRKYKGGMKHV